MNTKNSIIKDFKKIYKRQLKEQKKKVNKNPESVLAYTVGMAIADIFAVSWIAKSVMDSRKPINLTMNEAQINDLADRIANRYQTQPDQINEEENNK